MSYQQVLIAFVINIRVAIQGTKNTVVSNDPPCDISTEKIEYMLTTYKNKPCFICFE